MMIAFPAALAFRNARPNPLPKTPFMSSMPAPVWNAKVTTMPPAARMSAPLNALRRHSNRPPALLLSYVIAKERSPATVAIFLQMCRLPRRQRTRTAARNDNFFVRLNSYPPAEFYARKNQELIFSDNNRLIDINRPNSSNIKTRPVDLENYRPGFCV
jgi:hypothetical protein